MSLTFDKGSHLRARLSCCPALGDHHEEELVDLKITVDGLETERDFYFQKLRDIEILCQALEAMPNPNITVEKFVEDVQRVLYAKDEGLKCQKALTL
eukprot:6037475-Amphidinium_carterae.1